MSRLPDIIQQTKDDINQAGLLSGMVGHVGDGNFHCKWDLNQDPSPSLHELNQMQQSSSSTSPSERRPKTSCTGWSSGRSRWKGPSPANMASG